MTRHEASRFAASVTVLGDSEYVRVHLTAFDETDESFGQPMLSEVLYVTMEGGEYDRAEWLREVFVAVVEKL